MKSQPLELINGTMRPITDTIGFFQTDATAAANAFLGWRDRTYSRDGRKMHIEAIEGGALRDVLCCLLPLTTRPCRWLFVDTGSDWCAYFMNWWRGTDPTGIGPLGANHLHCRSIRCTNVSYGMSPATMIEVYRSTRTEAKLTERSICAMKDGSTWSFEAFGKPFGFEQTQRYQERRKRDRFTPEMLDVYLRHFGILAFDDSYYCAPTCTARLVYISGPPLPDNREYGLEDAVQN